MVAATTPNNLVDDALCRKSIDRIFGRRISATLASASRFAARIKKTVLPDSSATHGPALTEPPNRRARHGYKTYNRRMLPLGNETMMGRDLGIGFPRTSPGRMLQSKSHPLGRSKSRASISQPGRARRRPNKDNVGRAARAN